MMEREIERKQREAQEELAKEWEKIELEKAKLKGTLLPSAYFKTYSRRVEEETATKTSLKS